MLKSKVKKNDTLLNINEKIVICKQLKKEKQTKIIKKIVEITLARSSKIFSNF